MKRFRRFCAVLLIISGVVSSAFIAIFSTYLRPRILAVSQSYAENEISKIIDEQVQKLMLEEFLSYDKLTHISRDSSGRVTSISTNSVLINNFANNLDIEIGEIIDSTDRVKNELYLSSLIGFDMLSGVGPKIPIRFQPVSVTHADISHVFEEAGINQTIHTIILIISVDIQIMLPLAYSTITVKSEMPIAQTLIVGTVPETYFNKK